MNLRCKEGDLALIVREDRGCEANIGRIVQVRGPIRVNGQGLPTWLIKPVSRELFWTDRNGVIATEVVYWKSYIEHPDAWMVPLRPPVEDEHNQATRDLTRQDPEQILVPLPLSAPADQESVH